jgi:uncharacterized protein (TIGR02444 family)
LERQKTRDAAASLWEYALRVYNRDGVAAACLAAQDGHGLDVNLLLFAAWLAAAGGALDEGDARRASDYCRAWREEVVQPLRRRRRAWKHAAPHPRAYTAIKALEIEAERQQLVMLAELAQERGLVGAVVAPPESQASDLLHANLRVVAAAAGVDGVAVAGLAAALGADTGP